MNKPHNISKYLLTYLILIINFWTNCTAGEEAVTIGLNYPVSGLYRSQGIQQRRAADLAIDEINATGGILGQSVRLIQWDSQSDADVTIRNVTHMIERDKAVMIFGSVSSADAIAAGAVCQSKNVPFFATLAFADEITGLQAHRFVFRECYNVSMAAKALSQYLRDKFPANINRYFYIATEDMLGKNNETELRANTGTENSTTHKEIFLPFPVSYQSLWNALKTAQTSQSDVLVLALFGNDLVTALKLVVTINLKSSMQIVVPSITQGIAQRAGEKAVEGIISTTHWTWEVPYQYNYPRGQTFVEKFFTRYGNTPSTSAASAYTVVYEYKAAVERAGTFVGPSVVKALEGHKYQLLKDQQIWRDFDHQSIQSVYIVRGRFHNQLFNGYQGQSTFEILHSVPGDKLMQTREQWNAVRLAQGKPIELEALP